MEGERGIMDIFRLDSYGGGEMIRPLPNPSITHVKGEKDFTVDSKKIIIPVICIILILILSACDPMMIKLEKSDLENKVVKVELIHYENPKQKKFASWIPDHSSQLKPLDFDNVTIIQELPYESISAFYDQISTAFIRSKYYIYDTPKGLCLRLTNKDGSFMIYCCDSTSNGFLGIYSQEGEILEYIGAPDSYKEYVNLINVFFGIHINE